MSRILTAGFVALTVTASLLSDPPRVAAQVSFGGCYVGTGYPVPSIANYNINDIAMAGIANGQPVIYYNPNILNMMSPPTQFFFYFHECAHHVLGHTIGYSHPLSREQEADCWAIRQLVGSGRFGAGEVNAVQRDLANFGRGDWSHLPGPQRAINLQWCLR